VETDIASRTSQCDRGVIARRLALGISLGRDFNLLWLGESVSVLGTRLTSLAVPTLAIFDLHASALEIGLLSACSFAGYALVEILGAPTQSTLPPFVYRFARRPVLLAMNVVRAVALGSVPLVAALGLTKLWQLALVALVVSGCSALFDTAYQATLPRLIPAERLLSGNARL